MSSSLLCKTCKKTGHLQHNSSCPMYNVYLIKKQKKKSRKVYTSTPLNGWLRFCAIKRRTEKLSFDKLKPIWDALTDKEREYYKTIDINDNRGAPPPFPEALLNPPPPFPEHILLPPPPFPKELLPKPLLPTIPYKSIEKIVNKIPAKSIEKELIEEFQSNVSKLQSILFKLRKLAK